MSDLHPCPCCGQPALEKPFWLDVKGNSIHIDGEAIHVTPNEVRFLIPLERHFPDTATKSQIIHSLYGDRSDGGPITADKIPYVMAAHLRKRFAGTRLGLIGVWGTGMRIVVKEKTT